MLSDIDHLISLEQRILDAIHNLELKDNIGLDGLLRLFRRLNNPNTQAIFTEILKNYPLYGLYVEGDPILNQYGIYLIIPFDNIKDNEDFTTLGSDFNEKMNDPYFIEEQEWDKYMLDDDLSVSQLMVALAVSYKQFPIHATSTFVMMVANRDDFIHKLNGHLLEIDDNPPFVFAIGIFID